MAEITPEQVHDLLTGTHEYLTSAENAAQAKDALGHLLLDVARKAKAGLRDLSAVSGLHHATIRAMIQRAIGPTLPEGWDQPELPIYTELADQPAQSPKPGRTIQPMPPAPPPAVVTAPALRL